MAETSEERLTDAEVEHLIRIYEAASAQALAIRVHHEGSVDIRTLKAMRELRCLRATHETSVHLGWNEEERKCLIQYHDFHGRQMPDPEGAAHRYRAEQLRRSLPLKASEPIDLNLEPIGKCNKCGRKVWKPDTLGKLDEMTQPDGSQCGGRFIAL